LLLRGIPLPLLIPSNQPFTVSFAWQTLKSLSLHSSVASSYSTYNTKVIERMGREIISRLDWIGAHFLDPDAGGEGDDAVVDAEKVTAADGNSAEADGDGSKGALEKKLEVRLLDYACGPGMVSRVRLLLIPDLPG
jgi:hypothetical protein